MANIHRIGDYENNNYNRMGGGDNMQQDLSRLRNMNIPFMNLDPELIPPRKETFWDMLRLNFCPRLKLISFTVFVSVLNVILFIVTSCQTDGILTNSDSQFLQQNPEVLIKFGANYPKQIKYDGQIWRLVTAAFLHGSFFHIFMNTVSTFIFVSSIERSYGVFVTVVMWIICAIGGNIFSADLATAASISVGASTSLMGMLGLYLAFLILNWKALEFLQQMRCMLLCIAFFMIMLIFLMSSSSFGYVSGTSYKSVDNYGHLGGFITGVLAGVVIPKGINNGGKYERNAKYFCGFLLALFFILSFTLFFTATPDI